MHCDNEAFQAIEWCQQSLQLIDQRLLPQQRQFIHCYSAEEIANAIRNMAVRGAPAIGISAAYGIALDALAGRDLDIAYQTLAASRPTAVNLFWALDRMRALATDDPEHLLAEAKKIHEQDISSNKAMGAHGAALLAINSYVYTHCNTGTLATGGHGTALGVIRSAMADGKIQHVYAGETRPWLQGARLTAWELMQDNIPVSLVCDGAAAQLFRQSAKHKERAISWLIVGADRITANGDVANKIGTYSLAVLARQHNVRMMVVAPTTTFDLTLPDGDSIPIEQRPAEEITEIKGQLIAPAHCAAVNPSFDVTPAELIDVIVTERGVIEGPSHKSVAQHFNTGHL